MSNLMGKFDNLSGLRCDAMHVWIDFCGGCGFL